MRVRILFFAWALAFFGASAGFGQGHGGHEGHMPGGEPPAREEPVKPPSHGDHSPVENPLGEGYDDATAQKLGLDPDVWKGLMRLGQTPGKWLPLPAEEKDRQVLDFRAKRERAMQKARDLSAKGSDTTCDEIGTLRKYLGDEKIRPLLEKHEKSPTHLAHQDVQPAPPSGAPPRGEWVKKLRESIEKCRIDWNLGPGEPPPVPVGGHEGPGASGGHEGHGSGGGGDAPSHAHGGGEVDDQAAGMIHSQEGHGGAAAGGHGSTHQLGAPGSAEGAHGTHGSPGDPAGAAGIASHDSGGHNSLAHGTGSRGSGGGHTAHGDVSGTPSHAHDGDEGEDQAAGTIRGHAGHGGAAAGGHGDAHASGALGLAEGEHGAHGSPGGPAGAAGISSHGSGGHDSGAHEAHGGESGIEPEGHAHGSPGFGTADHSGHDGGVPASDDHSAHGQGAHAAGSLGVDPHAGHYAHGASQLGLASAPSYEAPAGSPSGGAMPMSKKMIDAAGYSNRVAPASDMATPEKGSVPALKFRILATLAVLSLVAAVLIGVVRRTKDRGLR